MIPISSIAKIFLCNIPVDLRKGFEGLSGLVLKIFDEHPTSGAYFVFLNKSQNMMKILYWDGDGFAIWHKRLEKGSFRARNIHKTEIRRREFLMLLEGVDHTKVQKRFSIH